MKHTLTRLLALALCLCLVIPFAGCGNSEEPVEEPNSSDVSTDPTESTDYTGATDYTDYTDPIESTEYTESTDYTDFTDSTTIPMVTDLVPPQEGTQDTTPSATMPTQTGVNTQTPPQASTGGTTKAPTNKPTQAPTKAPANTSTQTTTKEPANTTTQAPTKAPTKVSTQAPTKAPTNGTAQAPTYTYPSYTVPTYTIPSYTAPTTQPPTQVTHTPTNKTTKAPTQASTKAPTQAPTKAPTNAPTKAPTTTVAPIQGTTQAPTTTNGKKPVVTFTTTTEWTTTTTAAPKNPLRVLSIGHSFSKDAMEAYLWDLLKESGKYDYIVCAYLFYPGCPLDGQWDRINGNIDPETGYAYEYQQYRKTDPYYGSWSTQYKPEEYKNLAAYAIKDEPWDIITLQPSPDYGAGPEKCDNIDDYDQVGKILNWITSNKTNRNAKIYYHMTWSFAEDCRLWSFRYSNYDQMQMYKDFVNATKKYIFDAHPGKFAGIIPSGTSIQNARSSRLGDVFNEPGNFDPNKDGYHLNKRGDLVAALTWYSVLTGKSATTATCPTGYEADFDIFAEAVDAAIKTPYDVTPSSYK